MGRYTPGVHVPQDGNPCVKQFSEKDDQTTAFEFSYCDSFSVMLHVTFKY